MKKLNYEELGKYLKSECEKEFKVWFSDYWRDYEEELLNANVDDEEGNLQYQSIEIVYGGRPIIIELIYDIENGEYYIN